MRRSRHIERTLQCRRQGRDGHIVGEARKNQGPAGLRRRQHLEGEIGEGAEGAERAGHQFADIVAGDVLDHPAAGLEGLAAAADRVQPQQVVAGRARLDPPRTGQVASEDAADGRLPGLAAEERAEIGWLEGQLLIGGESVASTSDSGVPGPADITSSSGSCSATPDKADRSRP